MSFVFIFLLHCALLKHLLHIFTADLHNTFTTPFDHTAQYTRSFSYNALYCSMLHCVLKCTAPLFSTACTELPPPTPDVLTLLTKRHRRLRIFTTLCSWLCTHSCFDHCPQCYVYIYARRGRASRGPFGEVTKSPK